VTGEASDPSSVDHLPPDLKSWAQQLERGRWSGFIIDKNLILRFVSPELKWFLRSDDDEEVGVGKNVLEALLSGVWSDAMSPDSVARLMPRVMAYMKTEFDIGSRDAADLIPEPLLPLLDSAADEKIHGFIADNFEYNVPGQSGVMVEFALVRMRDHEGAFLGGICVTQMGVRPKLVSLLARGDESMYEKMADLQEPRRCQGAILFADLQGSTALSRSLPTGSYFSLIRRLATSMDDAIATHGGIVGKHAGDGISGFFLVTPERSASDVAAGAIKAARTIHLDGASALIELGEAKGIEPTDHGINIGLHWAASIYMGQLVPGGRLEVTALGDPVNECARVQETARDGAILASKHLVEQLTDGDAEELRLDPDRLNYTAVADIPSATEKAKLDAGSIPVTQLAT
jgi:class 3 adenylate cyclase